MKMKTNLLVPLSILLLLSSLLFADTLPNHRWQNSASNSRNTIFVRGKIVGSDNPSVGLSNGTVYLTGSQNYTANTDNGGNFFFELPENSSYSYLIIRDGYQPERGNWSFGTSFVQLDNIVMQELILAPGDVEATYNVMSDAVELNWGNPGSGSIYFFDFEGDGGGWVAGASWGNHEGDWQYTNSYDADLWVPDPGIVGGNIMPPPYATSGTGIWGTRLYTTYTVTSGVSTLAQTFDFSMMHNATMRFMS